MTIFHFLRLIRITSIILPHHTGTETLSNIYSYDQLAGPRRAMPNDTVNAEMKSFNL